MKGSKLLITSTMGVAIAAMTTIPVFACTPKGSIIKYVQDQTTGSQMVDANTTTTALTVHPGDTLLYTVSISNSGGPTNNDADDMVSTTLSDTLPSGVTPTSGSAILSENLGTVKEKQSITKTYSVAVNANDSDGEFITNKACYTGKATNGDTKQNQSGCDIAIIKVSVPTPTPTPTSTPSPTPQTQAAATSLPNTGAGNLFLPAGLVSGLGYTANLLRLKRRK